MAAVTNLGHCLAATALLILPVVARAADPPTPKTPTALSDPDKAAIRRDVRKTLKDPESAKFGPMTAKKDAKGIVYVCGLVNAKNSYGGYTGMQHYMGILLHPPKKPVAFASAGMGAGSAMVCAEDGMALTP